MRGYRAVSARSQVAAIGRGGKLGAVHLDLEKIDEVVGSVI